MQMKNDEIVARYRQAKNKGEQVKILAQLNDCPVERIIGILTSSGIDNRCFNVLRGKQKEQEREETPQKIPYKKPEIIPEPPKAEQAEPIEEKPRPQSIDSALGVLRAEIADINRKQYELDIRKADLYKQIWDMLGEVQG